jgi:hypothetical protein
MLHKIEAQYGKANRTWVMDRGIPTEEVLAEMRAADPPVSYLVGTPKGRLSKLEKALLTRPWQAVHHGVDVKLLPQDQELYVFAQSHARVHKNAPCANASSSGYGRASRRSRPWISPARNCS